MEKHPERQADQNAWSPCKDSVWKPPAQYAACILFPNQHPAVSVPAGKGVKMDENLFRDNLPLYVQYTKARAYEKDAMTGGKHRFEPVVNRDDTQKGFGAAFWLRLARLILICILKLILKR